MKRQIKLCILLVLLGLVSASPAYAGNWLFGAKTGTMNIDDSDVDDPKNNGIMVGYEIGIGIGDVALEGEYTTTASKGDVGGLDVELETMAIYAAFRSAGPIYFKGKVGSLHDTVKVEGLSDESETQGSAGIGVGFSLGLIMLELELTRVKSDVTYASIGVVF